MQVTIPYKQLETFCERHQIKRLAVFGSVLREDFRPDSDIDVLIELDESRRTTFLDMVEMRDELSAILGRSVDLLTPNALSNYFRDDVLSQAQVIYER